MILNRNSILVFPLTLNYTSDPIASPNMMPQTFPEPSDSRINSWRWIRRRMDRGRLAERVRTDIYLSRNLYASFSDSSLVDRSDASALRFKRAARAACIQLKSWIYWLARPINCFRGSVAGRYGRRYWAIKSWLPTCYWVRWHGDETFFPASVLVECSSIPFPSTPTPFAVQVVGPLFLFLFPEI